MLKDLHKVIDKVDILNQSFNEQLNQINERFTSITQQLKNLNEKISLNEKQNQEQIK